MASQEFLDRLESFARYEWGGKSCLAERLNLKSQIAKRQRKRPGRLTTEASSICEDGRSLRQFRSFTPLLRPILPTPK
jgi:hypothetical protein